MENEENKIVGNETVKVEQAPETKAEIASDEKDKTLEKYKRLLDKANSEAADYKRQLRAKMSEDEVAENERNERQKAMEAELASLKKEKVVSDFKINFMKVGFDEATAQAQAQALADGDTNTMFSNLFNLTDSISKSAVAKAMDNQKGLSVGNTLTTTDVEKAANDKLRRAMGLPV